MAFLGWNIRHHIAWNGETEIVRLDGGEFKLSGLFVKPNGEGPHAAVVILHGSGRLDGIHDIPSYRVHANAFLRKGLAVLVYDKRGVGNSDGDFSVSTNDDFVQDAVAAVRYLRSRNDVDSLRIGLLGSSEGGWLTPEVATLAGDIAFVVNRCGPPLPWDETVLFEIENDLEAEGTDPEIIQEVLRLKRIIWKYYVDASTDSAPATGTQRDEIDAALSALYARAVDSDSLGLPQ
ncbi:MAG: alpha/beta fold hydrolase, partial [Candidatus Hydrogenedentota bacterium]